MTFDISDRPDIIREVGQILLLQYFSEPLLGDFSSKGGFLSCRSQLGFVLGSEGRLVELVMWPVASSAGRTKGPNLVSCYCFLLLCCSGELLLGNFLATWGSSGKVSQLGFVSDYERSTIVVAASLKWLAPARRWPKRCWLDGNGSRLGCIEGTPSSMPLS